MNKELQAISEDMERLADDAGALMDATAEVAGGQIGEARRRLAQALGRGRAMYGVVCDKTIEGARAADGVVRQKPYQAIGIGLAAGILLGYLFSRR